MQFELNKNYNYNTIVNSINADWSINEYGENEIGNNFISLENAMEDTRYSFVLTGFMGRYIYKCIWVWE